MKDKPTPRIIRFNEYKYVFLDQLEGELGQEKLCELNKNGDVEEHISQVYSNLKDEDKTVDNALEQAKIYWKYVIENIWSKIECETEEW